LLCVEVSSLQVSVRYLNLPGPGFKTGFPGDFILGVLTGGGFVQEVCPTFFRGLILQLLFATINFISIVCYFKFSTNLVGFELTDFSMNALSLSETQNGLI